MNDTKAVLGSEFEKLGLAAEKPKADDRQDLGQEEFFELMVAQITNQDPLQPLTNEEFISQVAQLSTVSGVQSIERSISDKTINTIRQNYGMALVINAGGLVVAAMGMINPFAAVVLHNVSTGAVLINSSRLVATSLTASRNR